MPKSKQELQVTTGSEGQKGVRAAGCGFSRNRLMGAGEVTSGAAALAGVDRAVVAGSAAKAVAAVESNTSPSIARVSLRIVVFLSSKPLRAGLIGDPKRRIS
jgi:hypothetical protein